jgi:hypothetical protein
VRELLGYLARRAEDARANCVSDYDSETETDTKHTQQAAATFSGVRGLFHRYV